MRVTLVLLILLLGQPALSYCVHAPSSASSSRRRRPLPALHATPDLNRRPANPTAACGAAVGAIPRGGGTTAAEAVPSPRARLSASLPCGDELDKKILKLSLPAVCNFLILPLTQATDLFWVGRIGDAMALAAQAAANQVFSSAFWLTSFIPTITTPLVAAAHAKGDREAVRRHVGGAIFFSALLGLFLSVALASNLGGRALAAVGNANGLDLAVPYLRARLIGVIPDTISTVGFASFRGVLDTVTPLYITLVSSVMNAVLDPLLIFGAKIGLNGAALATAASQVVAAAAYLAMMLRRDLVRVRDIRPPSRESLARLASGGAAVQVRAIALNAAFIAITRKTQRLDDTGVAAAAHAVTIQLWQLGGVILFAASTVAGIIVPSELNKKGGGVAAARRTADRFLGWGVMLGGLLGAFQLAALPLLGVFSPVAGVQQAARAPSVIGAALQLINGVTFIGEGVMVGTGSFGALAAGQIVATAALLLALRNATSLAGVWWCFWLFNGVRFANVLRHHFVSGPLATARERASA